MGSPTLPWTLAQSAALCVGDLLLASLDVVPNNLPVQLTSFIGREAECETVAGLVAANRLVTLTGARRVREDAVVPPGCGRRG
jgi:hypothetical protein